MREIGGDELRKIQLELLKEFASFCDKNNIRYFLCGGTLLGAVRHKGYIPWDDDIDVMMPRKDYESLIKKYQDNEKYSLFAGIKNKGFPFPYCKFSYNNSIIKELSTIKFEYGINIDIFPIDGLPANDKKMISHLNKIRFYRRLRDFKLHPLNFKDSNLIKNIIVLVLVLISWAFSINRIVRMIDKIAKMYDYEDNDFVGISVWGYGKREQCEKSVFENFTTIEFENNYFKVPGKYQEYLQNVYGNYMELPPENKRMTTHLFKAYL